MHSSGSRLGRSCRPRSDWAHKRLPLSLCSPPPAPPNPGRGRERAGSSRAPPSLGKACRRPGRLKTAARTDGKHRPRWPREQKRRGWWAPKGQVVAAPMFGAHRAALPGEEWHAEGTVKRAGCSEKRPPSDRWLPGPRSLRRRGYPHRCDPAGCGLWVASFSFCCRDFADH